MDFRVDNSNAQPLASGRDSGQQGTAAHAGSGGGVWRGADVKVVDDAVDLLTDAAEEISFSHSEQVESRKLEERDIEEPAEPELHSVEAILAYLEAAGHDHPDERLRRFVDELKRKAHEGREGDPREEARRSFGGVTEQFLALSFAARELAESPEHAALHEQVRTALQALQEESGARICADLNTIGVAGQFGQGDATRTAAFQSTYRDAVLGGQDLTSMLKGALDRFGESDYRAAVQHLIRALGDDLGAMRGSSAEPARLNAVLQDLYSMGGARHAARRVPETHRQHDPRARPQHAGRRHAAAGSERRER
ncbi:MAG: HrpJ domain-containing protein [Gammaproteobacteria bacterium]